MSFKQDVKDVSYGSGITAIVVIFALLILTGIVAYYYVWAPTMENKNYEIITNTNSFIQTQLTSLNDFYAQVAQLKTQIAETKDPEKKKAYQAQIRAITIQMNQVFMQLSPKQRGHIPAHISTLLGE